MSLAHVHFVDTRKGVSADEKLLLRLRLPEQVASFDWSLARDVAIALWDMEREPPDNCEFAPIPEVVSDKRDWDRSEKQLVDYLYRTRRYGLLKSQNVKTFSRLGESSRHFRIRLTEQSREERDRHVERLRKKYAAKIRTLEARVTRAEDAVQREQPQAKSA